MNAKDTYAAVRESLTGQSSVLVEAEEHGYGERFGAKGGRIAASLFIQRQPHFS